jgi:hypothetical protein
MTPLPAQPLTLYLAQVNQAYGENVYLPYSVGLLWSYASQNQAIRDGYRLGEFLFLRETLAGVLARLHAPDVLGISCYIWNMNYSMALARAVKERFPACLIVLGGPQVPNRSETFFAEHSYADLLVHQEGEAAFRDVLLERLQPQPDYTRIGGLSVRTDGTNCRRTGPGRRLTSLDEIPSPYIQGAFDELLRQPYSFQASQETHRGCPYSCTFCDWGSAVFTKVRAFGDERLTEELDWFGRNGIEVVYNCDANYGMLKRDYDLTLRMTEIKRKYGFPRRFRAAYAKKSNQRIFEIASLLSESGMNKGVTLSMQSMDAHTLDVVKRSNIRIEDFAALLAKYKQAGIATYTEVIIGLPGETYPSFVRGLNEILLAGQHDSINVYPCMSLINSEMADPAYVAEHGIRTVCMPIMWLHASVEDDPHPETNDIVVATSAMPTEDWRRMYLFGWAIQAFHCLGLTQSVALFMFARLGMAYSEFYERLLRFAARRPATMLGAELAATAAMLDRVLNGGDWDCVDPAFGPVHWPPEELTFLRLVADKERFFNEIGQFVAELLPEDAEIAPDLVHDLLTFQKHVVCGPCDPAETRVAMSCRIDLYVAACHQGNPAVLRTEPVVLAFHADHPGGGDLVAFAREVVWYGRKGGRFRNTVHALTGHAVAEPVLQEGARW